METLAGFQKTGRVTRGPASDLVELLDGDGFPHTAIAFHPQYRDHPAIGAALSVVKGFLEAPYVTGMVELVAHVPEEGAFVYPTGECWSVQEVIRKLADLGQTAGVRAGLELLYAAGQILIEAADSGEAHAVYSHGGLTPWRLLIKADGQVQIIGHAVPQVEILQFHQDPDQIPKEDAFRYCPPERMEAEDEDLSSDLFSLALVAFELMTGRPVYDGLVNDIRTQAARGEGSRRLFRFKDQLPSSALDLLRTCLKPDPEHRHQDGDEFLETVQKVLASREAIGPPLMEIMEQVGGMQRPPGEGLEAGKTVALDKDSLRKMVADLEAEGDGGEPEESPGAAARESFKPSSARRPRRARRVARSDGPEELAPAAPIEDQGPAPRAVEEESDDRWKKPVRRGRTRDAEDADGGGPSAHSPKEERGLARSGAGEILQKLKSSSDHPGRRRERSDGGGAAAKLIESILSSSENVQRSRGGEPSGTAPEPEAVAAEAEVDQKAGQARARPSRGRRPVRRRSADSDGPSTTESPVPESPRASRPARGRSEPAEEASAPSPQPRTRPDPEPVVRPQAKLEAATSPEPAPAASEPVMAPKSAPKEEATAEPAPVSPAASSRPVQKAPRAPQRLKATGGASLSIKLRIAPDGAAFKTRFPGKASLAECVARLTASLLPIQADLSGRLTTGWRLGPESGPLAGNLLVESQEEGSLLLLHPIAARETVVEVRVEDPDVPHRFQAPVSNVLVSSSFVDHLVRWLSLPKGSWVLHAGGRVLGPYELLDEVDLSSTPLVLKR